jgi:hypothetical protein
MKTFLPALVALLVLVPPASVADNTRSDSPQQTVKGFTGRGYEFLTTTPLVPPDFDQEVFDNLWQAWEEPLRSQAENATLDQRRKMAFSRYGFTQTPGGASS